MTHSEFVARYQNGDVTVNIDRAAAGVFMTRRLLLPIVRLPVLGLGVALALVGWLWTGFFVIAVGTLLPFLVKRSAPNFVIAQSLQDPAFYKDALDAGALQITPPPATPHPPAPIPDPPARQGRDRG